MMVNQEPGRRQRILRAATALFFATICGMAFGFMAQVLCLTLISAHSPGSRDYVVYWATGQQLVHHANPYDGVALLEMERSAGFPADKQTMFMRNPPWTLPLVLPLGYVSARAGWWVWCCVLLACLVASVHMMWLMAGRPRNRRYLLGYTFAPALICLIYGQSSLLALLGVVLFLRLHRTRPFLAGVALWLCGIKPHLFLVVGVVFLVWVVVSRGYRVLAGLATATIASCAAVYGLNPMVWSGYSQMLKTSGIDQDIIPCLSYLLRHWISPQSMWLQYLPSLLAGAWALSYYLPRRRQWDWMEDGSPILLVSLISAPYCWLFDQVMAIPALLQGAFRARSRSLLIALAFASALIEIALFGGVWRPAAVHLWTYWTSPAWLVWYLLANSMGSKREFDSVGLAKAVPEGMSR